MVGNQQKTKQDKSRNHGSPLNPAATCNGEPRTGGTATAPANAAKRHQRGALASLPTPHGLPKRPRRSQGATSLRSVAALRPRFPRRCVEPPSRHAPPPKETWVANYLTYIQLTIDSYPAIAVWLTWVSLGMTEPFKFQIGTFNRQFALYPHPPLAGAPRSQPLLQSTCFLQSWLLVLILRLVAYKNYIEIPQIDLLFQFWSCQVGKRLKTLVWYWFLTLKVLDSTTIRDKFTTQIWSCDGCKRMGWQSETIGRRMDPSQSQEMFCCKFNLCDFSITLNLKVHRGIFPSSANLKVLHLTIPRPLT